MVAWDSHNASPPSLLWPPAGKWFARTQFPAGTMTVTAPNGAAVVIVELRGWLRFVAPEGGGGVLAARSIRQGGGGERGSEA